MASTAANRRVTSAVMLRISHLRGVSAKLEETRNSTRLSSQDAGGPVARCDFAQLGDLERAAIDCDRTARMEDAPRRRVERARYLAAQHHALALGLQLGVRDRHGGEQRLRVRMPGIFVEGAAVGDLHDLAQI